MNRVNAPRLMISAAHKSSGKTLVSLGILYNLVRRGMVVNSFKKGPDYIDPMWHSLVTGRACRNLDPFLMGSEGCVDSFFRHSDENTLSLIEGNHGLHDGVSLDGSDSSAGLACLLKSPVLLVVDSRKMNRGAAALVAGMQALTPKADIAGVILNRVRGSRQHDKQRLAIERLCGVSVLGAIPEREELAITERHLGLKTVGETLDASTVLRNAGDVVAECCDMEAVQDLFYKAPALEALRPASPPVNKPPVVTIGVFRDSAFCFYYPENLEALSAHGAKLRCINALETTSLPELDGLYLGGGFPESFLGELSSNRSLLREVRECFLSGIPLYAECGGLIYLSSAVHFSGRNYSLAGVLPFETGFQSRPVGHGYLELTSRRKTPWFASGDKVKAHEFHYSKPLRSSGAMQYQFAVDRGYGLTGEEDGVVSRNMFASFAHLHAVGNPRWAERFVELASEYRAKEHVGVK